MTESFSVDFAALPIPFEALQTYYADGTCADCGTHVGRTRLDDEGRMGWLEVEPTSLGMEHTPGRCEVVRGRSAHSPEGPITPQESSEEP